MLRAKDQIDMTYREIPGRTVMELLYVKFY